MKKNADPVDPYWLGLIIGRYIMELWYKVYDNRRTVYVIFKNITAVIVWLIEMPFVPLYCQCGHVETQHRISGEYTGGCMLCQCYRCDLVPYERQYLLKNHEPKLVKE